MGKLFLHNFKEPTPCPSREGILAGESTPCPPPIAGQALPGGDLGYGWQSLQPAFAFLRQAMAGPYPATCN